MCTAIHTMYHDDSICKILCLAPPSACGVSSHVRWTCTCCDTCGIKAGQCSAVETVVYVCQQWLVRLYSCRTRESGKPKVFRFVDCLFVFVGKFKLIYLYHKPLPLFRFRLLLSRRTERPGCGSRADHLSANIPSLSDNSWWVTSLRSS